MNGTTPSTALPIGTVTFLFTDIEGSTQRWTEDQAAMAVALAVHDETLRDAVATHHGFLFKHTGDGMCAVFASAPSAVAAAIDAQERLALPVRMGLHTGEAEQRDGDFFGPTLNRVARIMDAGHSGQILLSAATAALVQGVPTTDLGEHRVKGLATPERIYQVGRGEFPALRVATARKGNLPANLTEFVGRDEEVSVVVRSVGEHRLVTLLGVGGTGKTRLAIEAAHVLAPRFPDGTWIAELAQVLVPEAVPHALAAGLGLPLPERGDVMEYVVHRLRHHRLLLVVDNCEHVLDGAAAAVEAILDKCPDVTMLATSREPLMVTGERLVPTPSLSQHDAMALFVERARAEGAGVELDGPQLEAVARICERLDRLPLALELAASRTRSMSPTEIVARLDERFRLLVGGRRSRMERHQTMRGTVDWSYDLCSTVEQHVFDCLSVFVSDFDAAAAVAVAAHEGIDELDVEDAVARLIDRSLVQRSTDERGSSRLRLLETMRAYGHEKLIARGEAEAVRERHAAFVDRTLVSLRRRMLGPDEDDVHRRMRLLVPDCLVAVDWSVDQGDLVRGLRMAYSLLYPDPGTAQAMISRLQETVVAPAVTHDRAMQPVDPYLALYLEVWSYAFVEDTLFAEQSRRLTASTLELLRAGQQLPTVDVGVTALRLFDYWWVDGEPADLELIDRYVDSLSGEPAFQFREMWSFIDGLLQPVPWGDASAAFERAEVRRPALERLGATLNSVLATRMCHAFASLSFERRGDPRSGAERADLAIAGVTRPAIHDALAACRLVRMRARAGLPLAGADLRRPFEWCLAGPADMHFPNALCSVASALGDMGRHELAVRLIGQVRYGRQDFKQIHRNTMPPELLRCFDEPPSDTETVDDVLADLYVFADELDRQGGRDR